MILKRNSNLLKNDSKIAIQKNTILTQTLNMKKFLADNLHARNFFIIIIIFLNFKNILTKHQNKARIVYNQKQLMQVNT